MSYAEYIWNPYTAWIIWLIYAVTILSCIFVVLSENRNPIRSLSWVIALIFLPGIGLIFYLFFGRSLKGMHLISRRNKRKLFHNRSSKRVDINDLTLTKDEKQIIKLTHNVSRYPFTQNNEIEIYTDGPSKFRDLKEDLKNAKESILLQYYIFQDDKLGQEIADILISKAKEGVTVKVIYDHVGSFSSKKKFFKRMKENGVDTHPFFRVTFPQLANRINWRNHRKIVVIDREVGYIGGMNIANRYIDGMDDGSLWRDTHFRVKGEIVESLLYSFVIDWNFLTKQPTLDKIVARETSISSNKGMQLITSGPTETWDNLSLIFLRAISTATKCIYIQTPYFLPTEALLQALQAAALAKVDVRIMIPSKSDSKMLQYASYSYVTQCLKAGIKVYLYTPGMLHAKVMIIDDSFVTAGSVNFDFRSFENNFEGNILIYDSETNRKMKDIFFEDLAKCKKLTVSEWRKRPIYNKVSESVLRLLSPIL